MVEHIIIISALFFVYYNIGGLSTTNILRLTAGNTLAVNSSVCKCDVCGQKIMPWMQMPIISFVNCKGKCKNCGVTLQLYQLLLEIIVMFGMAFITMLSKFSYIGVIFSFAYYELIRIVFIKLRGRRKNEFKKQYLIAVISMMPFLLICLFIVMLFAIV